VDLEPATGLVIHAHSGELRHVMDPLLSSCMDQYSTDQLRVHFA
jgi:hypothetical protein